MKFGRRLGRRFTCAALIAFAAIAAHGELARWVQHQPAGSVLDVLLRSMPMPGGAVRLPRPPSETRPALTNLLVSQPKNAELYRLRAQEAEMQLDFTSAEKDWRTYAVLAADHGEGYLALADYYHRRVQTANEVAALQTVGKLPSDNFLPPAVQPSWLAYQRMLQVVKNAGLPATPAFQSWIARYQKEQQPAREFIHSLLEQKHYASAESQIAVYGKAFPDDEVFPVTARADLAAARGSDDAALRVYDQAFQPLWPKPLMEAYFALLDKNWQLREFAGRARAANEKNPGDLDAVARLFTYYQRTNNIIAARRALFEYRLAKEAKPGSWTPAELRTLAGLFERLPDINEQARALYALYSIPNAAPNDREAALAGLSGLLLQKPAERIRFGSGDLSMYKDIATADSSPGFLNGILSLVLNSTSPRWQYQQQNAGASAYFHRAAGAQLLDLLEKNYPASPHRAPLRASVVDAYASYGDDDAVITTARGFLVAFPKADERTRVALSLADALARRDRTQEEFAVYQQMLAELAARASGVPLGALGGAGTEANARRTMFRGYRAPVGAEPQLPGARSTEYVTVLNQYLARLSTTGHPMDAVRVYRRELDRNPNDPGLYERFAGFLEQNNLSADVQDIYRRAIAKFPDKSWYHKLARWYLRGKRQSDLTAITREVTGIFSGTELESYFSDLIRGNAPGPALYLQLNLYAHQRFPQDLVFVQNLLVAYETRETYDAAAQNALLHDYWFYDDGLKHRYFEELSSQGQLLGQLATLRREHPAIQNGQWPQLAASNPAVAEFSAEAEAWLGHFEAAAPAMRAIADLYPGSRELDARASSIYRSLAYYFPSDTTIAANLAQKAYDADPRDTKLLETVGDVFSDKDQFASAAVPWKTIPRIFPGKPDGYLEAATVYWDYYRFDDALRLIRQARVKFANPALYAYEAGVIEEGRRDYPRAVAEYLTGAQADDEPSRARIAHLAGRPAQRDLIYRLTANTDTNLRIAVLKAQQRRPELESFLSKEITVATQISYITPLVDAAREQGFDIVARQGLEREIAVTLDPVERMRLRIELVKYFEDRKDLASATQTMDALYRDNPLVLGVIRARVDFNLRNQRYEDGIAALTQASANARADLSAQFRFEAARIANTAGHIDQARSFLTELLHADPYRADYLALMADTYATANDDAGFVKFADTEIEALKKSGLPAEDRKSRIAALRRRLILTLARRNEFAAAIDQYIEVINQYPEDEAITGEATLFASAHTGKDQLVAFYRKTIAGAPRDWRWPIVLARIETALEDFPAALDAYAVAVKVRPDRADLVQARVALEERLLRFDDAIKSYSRLYELTYNDPQWLDKAAEFQARLGHDKEAVATLERAHISAGGETVSGLFAIAERLDEWRLTNGAATFAERGFTAAGNDFWTKYRGPVSIYATILADAHKAGNLLALNYPADGSQKIESLRTAGTRIAEIYTPEEKAALAAQSVSQPRQFAEAAGLQDNLARLLYQDWKTGNQPPSAEWIQLQSRRGLYEQLTRDLEAANALQPAATAASHAGDTATELRIYSKLQTLGQLPPGSWNRYLTLLLAQDPKPLVALAANNNRPVQFAIANGTEALVMDTLRARSRSLPPVWLTAYTALTGVYFDDRSDNINQAFVASLHPQAIGQRLALRPDAKQSLIGSIWFYYGARYGEYLSRGKSASAPDYLPAELEQRPADPQAYLELARFFSDSHQPAEAIAEFRAALDLDSQLGEAHNGIARALIDQGHKDAAIAEWRKGIATFEREQNRGVRVRETFWSHVSATIHAIADAKALPVLQGDLHHLLADYVRINGGYRVDELVRPALEASIQTKAGFEWLLDILPQTNGAEIDIPQLSSEDRERLIRFRLAYELREAASSNGYDKARFEQQSLEERRALIDLQLDHGKAAEALAEWKQFTTADLDAHQAEFAPLEIRLAGANGTIDRLIARYRTSPATAPPLQELLAASATLRQDKHVPAALSLLEFAYARELDDQHLEIANFLGLARVFLERGDSPASALAALRRMTLVAGAPFEGFEPAADLLIDFHHDADASEFLKKAVQATPWNASAKLKLARISDAADRNQLATQVTGDTTAPYTTRAQAAMLIAPAQLSIGGELALLASGNKSPTASQQPFFVESRLAAAANSPNPATKLALLREALAIAPDDQRVRLASVHAALDANRDSLALAIFQISRQNINDPALLESLARAAEKIGDPNTAIAYLDEALRQVESPTYRNKRDALQAEQNLRNRNASLQPTIAETLQQPHSVRPRNKDFSLLQ